MLNRIIEKCRLGLHRYKGSDYILRQECQEMVWHKKPIVLKLDELTNLRTALVEDSEKDLESVLQEIASKHGLRVAMQTSIWDPNFCYPNEVSNEEVEAFGIIKEIDWFSFAVKMGSINCIKWAVKTCWAHPGQMIQATTTANQSQSSDRWSGEKSTLRAVCWSGVFNRFNWIESFKDNEAAWLKFNSGAYTNEESSFLSRALEAVLAPNKILLHAASREDDGEELKKALKGKTFVKKGEIAFNFFGLRGVPGSQMKIIPETYRDFIDLGLCNEKDVIGLQNILGGEKFKGHQLYHVAWLPEVVAEMEARLLAKDIGQVGEKLVKKKILAL